MRLTLLARFVLVAVALSATSAIATDNFIQWTDSPGTFPVVNNVGPCAVQVDANDWPGVLRAVEDLKTDVKAVAGKSPQIYNTQAAVSSRSIIVGTLGKSQLIDRWVQEGRIDVSMIR